MTTITTRAGKGSALTHAEVDSNFSNLNSAKLELGQSQSSGTANGILYLDASKLVASGSGLVYDASSGGVGIGSTPAAGQSFCVSKNITGSTITYACTFNGTIQSDSTVGAYGVSTYIGTQAASFTAGAFRHFSAEQATIGAGSAITNQYGFSAGSSLTGATNNFGFHSNIASGTGRWNFYASGTADNYFAGAVGIGTTPDAGVRLKIAGTVTGATSIASYIGATASSAVSSLFGVRTNLYTAAAAFTLGSVQHFYADAATAGSGSTITNQYGFAAPSTLTTATNNFGFYGNIAAGTGRYNFYAAGTAMNYFAGDVGVGSLPFGDGSSVVRVNATRFAGTGGGASVYCDTTIPNTITGSYDLYSAKSVTAAGGSGVATVRAFFAAQGTLSTATTSQSGFFADSSLTGATNNYAFYSNIPSGTGRWNFYAAGTAANYFAGDMQFAKTITAGGTTGAQTINKNAGSVNFAAAATSLVVTNSLVTTSSVIIATVATNDSTMKSVQAVAAAGSFTLYANAAATAETRVNFIVIN